MYIYELDDGLDSLVARLVQYEEFSQVAEYGVRVKCCSKTKVDKDGDPLVTRATVKLAKVPDALQAVADYHFVLVVDGYFWAHATMPDKERELHRAMMGIVVELTEAGDVKVKVARPDIIEWTQTVRRYGPTLQLQALIRGGTQLAEQLAARDAVVTNTASGSRLSEEAGSTTR